LEWLDNLEANEPRVYAKCLDRILLLGSLGNELRRPIVDYLENGVYEIRAKIGRVNYRILYGFCGKNVIVLLHGMTKTDNIPNADLKRARDNLQLVLSNVNLHTIEFEVSDGDN
jgi:phage-related protein